MFQILKFQYQKTAWIALTGLASILLFFYLDFADVSRSIWNVNGKDLFQSFSGLLLVLTSLLSTLIGARQFSGQDGWHMERLPSLPISERDFKTGTLFAGFLTSLLLSLSVCGYYFLRTHQQCKLEILSRKYLRVELTVILDSLNSFLESGLPVLIPILLTLLFLARNQGKAILISIAVFAPLSFLGLGFTGIDPYYKELDRVIDSHWAPSSIFLQILVSSLASYLTGSSLAIYLKKQLESSLAGLLIVGLGSLYFWATGSYLGLKTEYALLPLFIALTTIISTLSCRANKSLKHSLKVTIGSILLSLASSSLLISTLYMISLNKDHKGIISNSIQYTDWNRTQYFYHHPRLALHFLYPFQKGVYQSTASEYLETPKSTQRALPKYSYGLRNYQSLLERGISIDVYQGKPGGKVIASYRTPLLTIREFGPQEIKNGFLQNSSQKQVQPEIHPFLDLERGTVKIEAFDQNTGVMILSKPNDYDQKIVWEPVKNTTRIVKNLYIPNPVSGIYDGVMDLKRFPWLIQVDEDAQEAFLVKLGKPEQPKLPIKFEDGFKNVGYLQWKINGSVFKPDWFQYDNLLCLTERTSDQSDSIHSHLDLTCINTEDGSTSKSRVLKAGRASRVENPEGSRLFTKTEIERVSDEEDAPYKSYSKSILEFVKSEQWKVVPRLKIKHELVEENKILCKVELIHDENREVHEELLQLSDLPKQIHGLDYITTVTDDHPTLLGSRTNFMTDKKQVFNIYYAWDAKSRSLTIHHIPKHKLNWFYQTLIYPNRGEIQSLEFNRHEPLQFNQNQPRFKTIDRSPVAVLQLKGASQ